MSKPWNPRRKTVAMRPSRIRRDPVRIASSPPLVIDPRLVRAAEAKARKREVWGGVGGVVLIAVALAVVLVGFSAATIFHDDPAAAQAVRFGQCYNGDVSNCVLDGGTINFQGAKVTIAGLDAPEIVGARCPDERSRGIDAAMRLAGLLNSGKVAVSATFRDEYGRDVRKVRVDGRDAGEALIAADVARQYDGTTHDWCD